MVPTAILVIGSLLFTALLFWTLRRLEKAGDLIVDQGIRLKVAERRIEQLMSVVTGGDPKQLDAPKEPVVPTEAVRLAEIELERERVIADLAKERARLKAEVQKNLDSKFWGGR